MNSDIISRQVYLRARATLSKGSVDISLNDKIIHLDGALAQVWFFVNGQRTVSQIRDELLLDDIEIIAMVKRLSSLGLVCVERINNKKCLVLCMLLS